MRPHVPQLFFVTCVGGVVCGRLAATMLLCLSLGFAPSAASCPPPCLCASDILSCSGRSLSMPPPDLPGYATRLDLSHNELTVLSVNWTSRHLDRLTTLVLSRNCINRIEVNAFAATPRLLHLDLSSNQLTALNSSVFAGLKHLRELLLFGNQVAQVNPGAFAGLRSLQRLYLSSNRLVDFPLGLYWEPGGPRNLTVLDVSHNRLSVVPVQNLLSLSRQQGDVYMQGNPLVCDCALLALLQYWTWKQYRPLVDLRGETPCGGDSVPECSLHVAPAPPSEAQAYQAELHQRLRVLCPGLASPAPVVFWVTPRTVVNSSTRDPNSRILVSPDGTLEIQSALAEDGGVYACVTARGRLYGPAEPLEVRVTVGNSSAANDKARRSSAEHFNTAFTTLASCMASIVLVLLYLYLTPCRCRNSRARGSRGCGGRAAVLCSDPREVESGQRQSNGKRVAFLEPQVEDAGVFVPKTPAGAFGHVTTEGILKNGSRPVGQALTDTAHTA